MKIRDFHISVAVLALAIVFAACSDDDSFTSSPQNRLTFSTDTVRLDTAFSTVPTPTKTFWVYNHSGNGIRCSNIRLSKGNQTGFRVNVDGIYLGEASGYQVNGIEVRNKDSIRVFVELTPPVNHATEPKKLEDDLIFTLESGVEQRVNLNAFSWDADMLRDVVVSKDSTLTSDKPIVIYGGITVKEGARLTINAGTTVYFHDGAGIDVYGSLNINGAADNNVVLRGDRLDRMFDYLPYDNVSGQWRGIHFYGQSYDNLINYADIHSACDAIVCDSSDIARTTLTLTNSIVHNSKGYGLLSIHSTINVENCQITNALNDCAAILGGKARLMHCTLAQFYPFDAARGMALRFANQKDGVPLPLISLECVNSIVTGYADDVLSGSKMEDTPFEYLFDHTILRTVKPEKELERMTEVIFEEPEDTVTGGQKNFLKIDSDMLRYDFRLSEASKAVGGANKDNYMEYDRLGIRRDENPDMGCYERVAE